MFDFFFHNVLEPRELCDEFSDRMPTYIFCNFSIIYCDRVHRARQYYDEGPLENSMRCSRNNSDIYIAGIIAYFHHVGSRLDNHGKNNLKS